MEAEEKERPNPSGGFLCWLGFLVAMALVDFILGWTHRATILVAPHQTDDETLAVFTAFFVLAALCVIFVSTRKLPILRRLWTMLGLGLISAVVGFMFFGLAAEHVTAIRDFPANRVQRYRGFLRLSRAYQTHGKGASLAVQTEPLWANFDVTKADYKFIKSHRSPEEVADDPNGDEIKSRNRFCLDVELEQASPLALRVLNAGMHKLPKGSVVLCPPDTPDLPNAFTKTHSPNV
jgi:hypothetical protein